MKLFFYPLDKNFINKHSLAFDLCKFWTVVDDPKEADVVAIIAMEPYTEISDWIKKTLDKNQLILILDIFHASEDANIFYVPEQFLKNDVLNKIIVLHTNYRYNYIKTNIKNVYALCYDVLFERQKLYCTAYHNNWKLDSRVWTINCNDEVYKLHPIIKTGANKFLSMMRIYSWQGQLSSRMLYRKRLIELLCSFDDILLNDTVNNKIFLCNGYDENLHGYADRKDGGVWYPASNKYYNDSYVSIYVETLTSHRSHYCTEGNGTVTEKTFDPMIQGNFVLPFSYSGFIEDCKKIYDFKFPDWIDYSYDIIYDDEDRFNAYLNSVKKLNEYSINDLHNLYLKDQNLLEHNRTVFFTRPYGYNDIYSNVKKIADDLV